MFSLVNCALLGLSLGTAALIAGCESNTPPQSALVASTQGVTCTKCQVTWVKVANRSGRYGRIVSYRWVQRDVCPDCMDAVTSFFNTGTFHHNCKTCGDSMEICEAHPH